MGGLLVPRHSLVSVVPHTWIILPYLEYFAKLLWGHLGVRLIDDTDIFQNDRGFIAT